MNTNKKREPLPSATQKLFGMDEYQLKHSWRLSHPNGTLSKPFVTYTAAADHARLTGTLTKHTRFVAPGDARLTLRALNLVHQFRSQDRQRAAK